MPKKRDERARLIAAALVRHATAAEDDIKWLRTGTQVWSQEAQDEADDHGRDDLLDRAWTELPTEDTAEPCVVLNRAELGAVVAYYRAHPDEVVTAGMAVVLAAREQAEAELDHEQVERVAEALLRAHHDYPDSDHRGALRLLDYDESYQDELRSDARTALIG